MNILYTTNSRCINPHGGLDRIMKLADRGHNVHILGTRVYDETFYEYSNGLHIHRCNSLVNLSQLQYSISFPLLYIRKLVREFDIDLIHGLGLQGTNTTAAGILTRFYSSTPFILSIEGISKTTGNPLVDILAKSYDFTLGSIVVKASRKVIVVGKALVERALKLGARGEKIVLCPPSVDLERFNPNKHRYKSLRGIDLEKSLVIGFVGRFVPLKGIFDLIEASKIVSKKYLTHLLLVGDGPLYEKVVRTTRSFGINSTVTGWVNNPETYYSIMDIFVLPSYSEGFPHTCLEAMAMKKPVIVTDVGANRELVIDGRNGFVVPPKNPKKLAQKIMELAENRSTKEKWVQTNREIVEAKYTLIREVKRLEEIYGQVTREPRLKHLTG